mmetsp:Transcript_38251/g.101148  ORF Transcript_38251/g.101148 Transcript_38251/m.101148 type:complete len:205 (+) Transcript_38251:337-951(+)
MSSTKSVQWTLRPSRLSGRHESRRRRSRRRTTSSGEWRLRHRSRCPPPLGSARASASLPSTPPCAVALPLPSPRQRRLRMRLTRATLATLRWSTVPSSPSRGRKTIWRPSAWTRSRRASTAWSCGLHRAVRSSIGDTGTMPSRWRRCTSGGVEACGNGHSRHPWCGTACPGRSAIAAQLQTIMPPLTRFPALAAMSALSLEGPT